jgi:hypothetical protein
MPTALKLSNTPSTHGQRYSLKPKIKKAREFQMRHLHIPMCWIVFLASIK